jgi:hypothetical protein
MLGCSNQRKETAPVRGRVTLDGKPLTSGTVSFSPDAGRAGGGEIGADGSYTVGTYTKSDGAIIGKHKVAVSPAGRGENDPGPTASEIAIPFRYHNGQSSGLEFEVVAGKDNVFDLSLTSRSSGGR